MNYLKTCVFFYIALIVLSSGFARAQNPDLETSPRLNLIIIVDTSPASSDVKDQLEAVIHKLAPNFQPGDRISVYTAHSGPPRLHLGWRIEYPAERNLKILDDCWHGIRFAAVKKADISQALQVALDADQDLDPTYSRVILVLGRAKFKDNQWWSIHNILIQAKNITTRIGFTVSEDSNRLILQEAAQGHCDALVLDRTDWQDWLKKARGRTAQARLHNDLKKSIPPVIIEPPPQQPLNVPLANSNPPYGQAEKPPTMKKPAEIRIPVKPPKQFNTPSAQDRSSPPIKVIPSIKKYRLLWRKVFTIFGIAVGVLFMIFWLGLHRHRRKITPVAAQKTEKSYRWLLECNGKNFDLGEEHTIHQLTLGSFSGSPVPLPAEITEDRHLRLVRRGAKVQVQNLASPPLHVNQQILRHGKKYLSILPVYLSWNPELRLQLSREEITVTDMSHNSGGSNHEHELITNLG